MFCPRNDYAFLYGPLIVEADLIAPFLLKITARLEDAGLTGETPHKEASHKQHLVFISLLPSFPNLFLSGIGYKNSHAGNKILCSLYRFLNLNPVDAKVSIVLLIYSVGFGRPSSVMTRYSVCQARMFGADSRMIRARLDPTLFFARFYAWNLHQCRMCLWLLSIPLGKPLS